MYFAAINDTVCIVTEFMYNVSTESWKGNTAQKNISGEMKLFRRGELPDFRFDDGKPCELYMEVYIGEYIHRTKSLMITSFKSLPGYDNCEAVYVEWIASSVERISSSEELNGIKTYT